jgi:hypothetical protein
MKVNADIRVVKSEHATEVFIVAEEPYINTCLYLPADEKIESGKRSIEYDPESGKVELTLKKEIPKETLKEG